MSRGYCLILGTDGGWRERAIPGAMRAFNGAVAIVSKNAPQNRNRYADYVLRADAYNIQETIDAVAAFEIASGMSPQAVIPLMELSLETGFAIAQKYQLKYLTAETMKVVRNKDLMKKAFQAAGIPTARAATIDNPNQLRSAAEGLRFPLVLKPLTLGGSEGVKLARTYEELEGAYHHGRQVLAEKRHLYQVGDDRFQIEEYIDSDIEVSIEVLNTPAGSIVLSVTDKYLSAPPYFAEIGHLVPSILNDEQAIRSTAIAACKSLGVDRGIAHVEMRILAGKPIVIEVNARTGGGAIMDLMERVYGFAPYELHTRSYLLDDRPELTCSAPRGRSAIAFLKANEGIIRSIRIPQASDIPPEIVGLYVTSPLGHYSGTLDSTFARDGAIEFYWPDANTSGTREYRHIETAAELSRSIFTTSKER